MLRCFKYFFAYDTRREQIKIYEYYYDDGRRSTSFRKKELAGYCVHHKETRREQNPK
jgi:hypothetical protein